LLPTSASISPVAEERRRQKREGKGGRQMKEREVKGRREKGEEERWTENGDGGGGDGGREKE
jgi:hypothetical protein